MKRLGDFIFWTIIAGTIVYIFFWPNTSIVSVLLKISFALVLFGAAYAAQLQQQIRDVEARLAELEKQQSELEEHVDGKVDSLKKEFDKAERGNLDDLVECALGNLRGNLKHELDDLEKDFRDRLDNLKSDIGDLGRRLEDLKTEQEAFHDELDERRS